MHSIRAVPEIILGGGGAAHFFPTPPPPGHTWVGALRPPGHVSALINLPHYGSNTPWPPGQVTSPPPTPRTHCQQNTLHPQDKKVFAAHPPLRIISGTALTSRLNILLSNTFPRFSLYFLCKEDQSSCYQMGHSMSVQRMVHALRSQIVLKFHSSVPQLFRWNILKFELSTTNSFRDMTILVSVGGVVFEAEICAILRALFTGQVL